MTQELIYTSAPRGLRPGTQGFCTVVSTQGMPINLAMQLESLSAYRHLFPPGSAQEEQNPVAWSHLRIRVGGREYHVLSRVAAAGVDYSRRSNKLAHHVVLGAGEMPASGPAWLLQQSGFMQTHWDGQVRILSAGRAVPPDEACSRPPVCTHWKQVAGDAGWAGVLAQTAFTGQQAVLVVPVGMDPLPLVAEALALLPPEYRWKVTFTTYYIGLPSGVDCQWRCVVAGTPEELPSRRIRGALVLDLTKPIGPAPDSPASQAARQGRPLPTPEPTLTTTELAAQKSQIPAGSLSQGATKPQMPMETPRPMPAWAESPLPTPAESLLQSLTEHPLPPPVPMPPSVVIHGFRRKRAWWFRLLVVVALSVSLLLAMGIAIVVRTLKLPAEFQQVATGPSPKEAATNQPLVSQPISSSKKPEATPPPSPAEPHKEKTANFPSNQSEATEKTQDKPPAKEEKPQIEPLPTESKHSESSARPKSSASSASSDSPGQTSEQKPSSQPPAKGPPPEAAGKPPEKKTSETTPGQQSPPQQGSTEKPSQPERPTTTIPSTISPPESQPKERKPSVERKRYWLKIPPPRSSSRRSGPARTQGDHEASLLLASNSLQLDVLKGRQVASQSLKLEFLVPEQFQENKYSFQSAPPEDNAVGIQILCSSTVGSSTTSGSAKFELMATLHVEGEQLLFQWKKPKEWEARSEFLEECLLLIKDRQQDTCLAIVQFQRPPKQDEKPDYSLKRGEPWPPLGEKKEAVNFSTKVPKEKLVLDAVLELGEESKQFPKTANSTIRLETGHSDIFSEIKLSLDRHKLSWSGILMYPTYQGKPLPVSNLKNLIYKTIPEEQREIPDRVAKRDTKDPRTSDAIHKEIQEEIAKLKQKEAACKQLDEKLKKMQIHYCVYHTLRDSQGKEYRVYIGFTEKMAPPDISEDFSRTR
ncbi:MAG: hypothetical protein NZ602_05525 [Thermoguttaceae bacterium]|nr:hypothetical protein [Thermoguttaceae bacterium]